MPKRTEKSVKKEPAKFSYQDLLVRIRAYIDVTYGGVAKFLAHEDFTKKCGFDGSKKDMDKMYIYLSLPREKEDGRRIRSFPVIHQLYEGLLGISLRNKIEVQRTQYIYADADKINALPTEAKAAETCTN